MPDTKSLRILILSGYDAASHRLWRENLMHLLPMHEWTSLSLPPRHFSWRLRGNALSFAYNQRESLSRPYDLLVATSMVDLSTLRGFIPALAKLPTLLYFHENQFAYPTRDAQRNNAETQLVPLYAALCADSLVFNSDYNRSTFLAGAKALLRRLPDHVPKGLAVQLENSHVLPVPVLPAALPTALSTASSPVPVREANSVRQSAHATLEVVWNHRWEYDKGPERLGNNQTHLRGETQLPTAYRRPTVQTGARGIREVPAITQSTLRRNELRRGSLRFPRKCCAIPCLDQQLRRRFIHCAA